VWLDVGEATANVVRGLFADVLDGSGGFERGGHVRVPGSGFRVQGFTRPE
jgi:hypothetical protein